MAVVTVAERIAFPADAVWEHINWHGVAKLTGGLFKKIDFFGDTPKVGITKRLHLAEGLPLLERLEALNEEDRTYNYQVIDMGSLPITDYRGCVSVTPAGPDACYLKIACEYTPVTVSAEEWATTWSAMESGLIEEIRMAIARGGPAPSMSGEQGA